MKVSVNNKCKAFTSLEQSRELAKILPFESADMHYIKHPIEKYYSPIPLIGKYSKIQDEMPCWSLATLINILPRSIEFKGDEYYLRFMKEYVEYANDEVSIIGRYLHTTSNNNLVDACVEMIIKLHENNKL